MKTKILSVVFVVVSLLSSIAYADSIYTGAWSKHYGGAYGVTNENHELIGYEHNNIAVATMLNSYGNRTYVAGYKFTSTDVGVNHLDASLLLGASYGYLSCQGYGDIGSKRRVCPALIPELSYTKFKLQPSVMLFPSDFDNYKPKTVAVAFAIKWEI
jgi:hypothetical protein